uniref:TF-B3 domain-containing protein n=1 Tax=Davidia involucrata TaxID=16924 RepID=A0A5B7CCL1_DAVIN
MGRSLNPGSRRPSFFKVLIGDFFEQSRIPPEFVKKHLNGVVPHKWMLQNPARRAWRVDMKKVGNSLFFQKGWGAFVQDNSLETGDFLLFRYDGNSQFSVEMYGKNCCEKDATEATAMSNKPSQFQRLVQEESAGEQVTPRTSCSSASEATQEDRALKEATKFMSISKYPSFKYIMRSAYLQSGYVGIPLCFVNRHMKEGTKRVKLQISNKSWSVNLSIYGRGSRLGGGWRKFARECNLGLGDVCVFELINRNDTVLKVSIFRHIN